MTRIKTNPTTNDWLSTPEVMARINIKRTKLNSLMRHDTTFPKPIRLSQNCLRWNAAEINRWIAEQEQKRGAHNG